MRKIRLVTLFSGYDSQALAMERLMRDHRSTHINHYTAM